MSALQWVRAKQRSLTRVMLALFCLAWLQAAAVPCVMAADTPVEPAHHCQYCPPPASAPSDAGHSDACAYPHEPQVDARIASGLFFALPVTPVIATLEAQPLETAPAFSPVAAGAPPTAFAVSYCRLLL